MTAIAGVAEDGKVWIGGDSAGVGGLNLETRTDPKVFVNGDFLFGYTSSFRMGQILEHEFSPPKPYEGEQGMPFMVKLFIPAGARDQCDRSPDRARTPGDCHARRDRERARARDALG